MSKTAVIGIDLGAAESYVSFVGKGIVDIVQNEASKRANQTLVGFTDRERLLGDSALAQIRSNAKNTCRNFKHLIGRKFGSPDLEIEDFWSTSKLCATDDGFTGYDVNYKGESRQMSATEVTAMYLTKLKETTEKWCDAKVADVVISAPSSYSDTQRQALLDAAKIAGLSVLRVMNEHTATALAYGIYRTNDFDAEKPLTVAFAAMGHSLFSVSIVQFIKGKLTVVAEKSAKVGGRDMDECLMRAFAAEFKKKHGCDPLSNKKASYKLEDAVTKTKKILSANAEAPVSVECLMEDEDFKSNMKREDLERMCEPMMDKVRATLEACKALAGIPVEQIDCIEIVGGGSRVPFVRRLISEAFEGKELSTTMNQEESVARGCALQAAILSPLYKVRDFRVEDNTPFGINVGWIGPASMGEDGKDEAAHEQMGGDEYKTALVFPAGSPMNITKMLTFFRDGPFEIKAEYQQPELLLHGTPKELGTFQVQAPVSGEKKKIKVKAKLTQHGTFSIEGAQMIEEEEYEDKVKEKRELPPDPSEAEAKPEEGAEKKEEPAAAAEGDAGEPNGEKEAWQEGAEDKKPEKKEPEKKYEWVEVVKMKKRTKRTDIAITATGRPGLDLKTLQKLMDQESAMIADMNEIIDTDARRNDLEGYIFNMRDKISEGGEYGEFIGSADRDKFNSALTASEDWLYDNENESKTTYIDKLNDLKVMGDPVVWRFKESQMRADWIAAVRGTIGNYREAAVNPGDKYGHIAADKLGKITASCGEVESWLDGLIAKQETLPKHEKPVLMCSEMETKNKDLAKMADEILKEPKPAPPKEEKKEEPAKTEAPKEEKKEEPAAAPADASLDVD